MILMVFSLLLLTIVRESCTSSQAECSRSVSCSGTVERTKCNVSTEQTYDCRNLLSERCHELFNNACANLTIKCEGDNPNTHCFNTDSTSAIHLQLNITLVYSHYSCLLFCENKTCMCSSTSVGPTSSCYVTYMRGRTTWCQTLHTTMSSLSQELSTTRTMNISATSPKHTISPSIMSEGNLVQNATSASTHALIPTPKHTISSSIMSSKVTLSTTSAISVMTTHYSSLLKQESLNQVFQSMSTQLSTDLLPDHTIANNNGQTMGLFVVVWSVGGTVLILMLIGIIILQCVILCQRKKGKHSQREGDLSERRVKPYSDCPLAANSYDCPVRGLRIEEAQHTGKELDECTRHRSAPSTRSLRTITTNTEEDYAVPHHHMNQNISTRQNARRAFQDRMSYPTVDSVTEATTLEDDYMLPQDHINNRLPHNQGSRGALEHTGNRMSNPAACPVPESSDAGGEHVYFALEPPCDLLKKSCGEEPDTKELPQNGTWLTQF